MESNGDRKEVTSRGEVVIGERFPADDEQKEAN
jgi:hypothetical protein